uniref:Uncharacterized protein n=1 Tax=Cryptomonas curvata TaxID=233186 RepID=A0A7S0MLP0_9CRYP
MFQQSVYEIKEVAVVIQLSMLSDNNSRTHLEEVDLIAEDEQERIVEDFTKKQERIEKIFSQLLFIISSPIFLFFLFHSYSQAISEWTWPFVALKGSDAVGRRLASFANLFTALSTLSSILSASAMRSPSLRRSLLLSALATALVSCAMWARVCYPISPFPWPHFLAVNAAPSASLFIQWMMVHTWRSTRAEIVRLAGLKYPLKSA